MTTLLPKELKQYIVNQRPGPAFDVVVARVVFGGTLEKWGRIPAYSTDPTCAWLVLQHLSNPCTGDNNYRYPTSIQSDRYSGSYSGGSWVVQVGCAYDEPNTGDGACRDFWDSMPEALWPKQGIYASHDIAEAICKAGLLSLAGFKDLF